MGQCDEFACYMTRDVAQWWLLYSLSLQSLLHHAKQRPCFVGFFLLLFLLAIIRKHPAVLTAPRATGLIL